MSQCVRVRDNVHHHHGSGGYYPVGLSMTEADDLRAKDMTEYKKVVQASLVRHVNAINKLVARGLKYGGANYWVS